MLMVLCSCGSSLSFPDRNTVEEKYMAFSKAASWSHIPGETQVHPSLRGGTQLILSGDSTNIDLSWVSDA
jgi:hypothetical protein